MQVVTGLDLGAKVLIDGVRHEAIRRTGNCLVFLDPKSGDERALNTDMQRRLALEFRLVDAELPRDYEETIAKARVASFNTSSFEERIVAQRRLKYVQAVLDLPPKLRNRKAEIAKCIDAVFAELRLGDRTISAVADDDGNDVEAADDDAFDEDLTAAEVLARREMIREIGRELDEGKRVPPDVKPPTPRSVRRWYGLYVASGRDVRVLLNLDCLKGNRTPRYKDFGWVEELVEETIDTVIARPTPMKFTEAWVHACGLIRAGACGRELPKFAKDCDGASVIGRNLVRRRAAKRDRFNMAVSHVGVFEARRRFDSVMLGPQGERPNHEWEVDHTRLDIMVVDLETRKIYGRPWLTAIIDRYSRCIVGFSISFAPPSWVSVMQALRIAIEPKAPRLAAVAAGCEITFQSTWDCQGIPDVLITDHGPEFKSRSMDAAMAMLGTRLVQTKRRKPWLKGKIERWFGTLEGFVHSLPGTTFSNFYQREFYKSEKFAKLDVKQLNAIVAKWIVDFYHHKNHSKIGCSPAQKWRLGATQIRLPRLIPSDQLEPSLGLVVQRCLRRSGVTFNGLRWDSSGFSRLRRRPSGCGDIPIRINPTNLSTAYAWDEANSKWVEGTLQEPSIVIEHNFTLDQWYYVQFNRKRLMSTEGLSRQKAIEQAVKEIEEYVEGIREGYEKSPAYRAYLEFTTQGKDAWALTDPIWKPDDGEVRPHPVDEPQEPGPPHHEFSPYRDSPSLSPDDEPNPEANVHAADDGAGAEPEQAAKPAARPRRNRAPKPKPDAEARQLDLDLADPPRGEDTTAPPTAPPDDDFVDDVFEGSCEVHVSNPTQGILDDGED